MLSESKAFSGFSVPDTEAARAFYTDQLGLEVSENNRILQIQLGGGHHAIASPKRPHGIDRGGERVEAALAQAHAGVAHGVAHRGALLA